MRGEGAKWNPDIRPPHAPPLPPLLSLVHRGALQVHITVASSHRAAQNTLVQRGSRGGVELETPAGQRHPSSCEWQHLRAQTEDQACLWACS